MEVGGQGGAAVEGGPRAHLRALGDGQEAQDVRSLPGCVTPQGCDDLGGGVGGQPQSLSSLSPSCTVSPAMGELCQATPPGLPASPCHRPELGEPGHVLPLLKGTLKARALGAGTNTSQQAAPDAIPAP